MPSRVSRRGLFHLAAGSAAGLALGAPPTYAQAPNQLQQSGIEPNTIKRRGTGFRGYDPQQAFPGSTLFAPMAGSMVYLIDLQGNVQHTWQMPYPSQYGYLTEQGTLFFIGTIASGRFAGQPTVPAGGVVLEADWSGKVLWELRNPDQHHDARLLSNGNALLMCATELPDEIGSQVVGGIPGTEVNGKILADYLVEMTPDGQTVWEWRTWEHLDPATHPYTMPSNNRADWTWANAVHELPDGNILLSLRHLSTIVRINRQTDEIDWELGAPPLSGAHGVNPLANGNYLIFDNGPYRFDQGLIAPVNFGPFSRVLEVDPSTNDIVWSYVDPSRASFWSPLISNPQRLPNGNTMINEGLFGRFFEVTPDGNTVWEYVNPYFGPASAPPAAQINSVFRAYRYTPDEINRARSA
ncbi:MAG: aryl-sulfate sulfotransferase [Chloroflexi bacterium]|nr:aryl-sulfate sulfotransferase [Chloroflexota bacterium]